MKLLCWNIQWCRACLQEVARHFDTLA